MKYLWASLSVVSVLLLSGCSQKEVYKPENIKGDWRSAGRLSAPIAQVTQSGAVLSNGNILTKAGEKKQKVPADFRLLNISDGWIITQNNKNDLELIPDDGVSEHVLVDLKRTVASASIQGDVLALLFGNNEMALYSLQTKKMTFKESSNAPIAVDARIANPYFLKDLVVFLSLDGKIVIVNATDKKLLRSIIVGSEEYFNNITYLNVIENNMVASTGNTVLSLSQKENREKYEVRDIAYTEDGVWLTTKQGEVVALSPALQYKAKKKFPFAHFVGISVQNDRVYVLEQGGYMIALSKNLLSYDVYDIDMDHDAVFVGDGKIYFDDRYIEIK
jgi:outer membrane protein assembly factor BamB